MSNEEKMKEIFRILDEHEISVSDFAYGEFEEWDSVNKCRVPIYGIGEWEEVQQFGGEGEGDTWFSVKYFKDHDIYIKTTGSYQSDWGTDFYNGFGELVTPRKKEVIVYD